MRKSGLKIVPQNNSESQALSMLGIDIGDLLQSVGNRIGRELALKLNDIDDDNEFWNRLAKKWKGLGMGELIITDTEILKSQCVMEMHVVGIQKKMEFFVYLMKE